MARFYVTSDPQIVAIHVPVAGVSASVMKSAFINVLGVGIRKLEEKRAKNFKFYEGTLAGGGRISFVPVAMINDVLHAAGVLEEDLAAAGFDGTVDVWEQHEDVILDECRAAVRQDLQKLLS